VQYEISNFARDNRQSRHNLKYWTRQPYLGFGADAHSMLMAGENALGHKAVRFSTPDSLDAYMNRAPHNVTLVPPQSAIEESFFLGLRLNRGIDLENLWREFGRDAIAPWESAIQQCIQNGLLEQEGGVLRLTLRGRLLSNEVFARFLIEETEETKVGTGHVNPR